MKGLIFTEFIDIYEDQFGLELINQVIEESDLPSEGVYTSTGNYDYREIIRLTTSLSKHTGMSIDEIIQNFGYVLFGRLFTLYPQLFEGISSALQFCARVDDYIHVEVRKLYPDATLPQFECIWRSPLQLEMIYRSPRCLGDLAYGLIKGCANHFQQNIEIAIEPISQDGSELKFVLTEIAS